MWLGRLYLIKMVCCSFTGKGDAGKTCILGKDFIDKSDARVEALGCFDELNAVIGVCAAFSDSTETVRVLKSVQDDMHTICAELGSEIEKKPRVTVKHVEFVEKIIEDCEKYVDFKTPYHFVIPGGSKEAATLHLARAVARRAERELVRLSRTLEINPLLLKYANRLSSLFYIMARTSNKNSNVKEERPTYKYYGNGNVA
jgi:cob(I)alamin adenosyltransferase